MGLEYVENRRLVNATEGSSLHSQAVAALSSPRSDAKAQAHKPPAELKLSAEGQYVVAAGDTAWSIAMRHLKQNGKAADARSIHAEIQRLVELNSDEHPRLRKNPSLIKPGMRLQIEAPAPPTAADCNQRWRAAEPDKITIVHAGQCFEADKNAALIVKSGGFAALKAGSRALLEPGGHITSATVGTRILALGGRIDAETGADVQIVDERPEAVRVNWRDASVSNPVVADAQVADNQVVNPEIVDAP